MHVAPSRLLLLCLALSAAPVLAQEHAPRAPLETPLDEPLETPIGVPAPIPYGFLIGWKPSILSVRIDSGLGNKFGSDKLQPLRFMGRYTTQLLGDHRPFLGRIEVEGGQFQTDTDNLLQGSNGYDVTGRALVGAATRIHEGLHIVASAGALTRYQRGRAVGGAPSIGMLGVCSNMELAFRVAPVVTLSFFVEGGLAPIPYGAQKNLGDLSDASEVRARLQLSIDVTRSAAVDIGYDFTRWHASFSQSSILSSATAPDQALLIESREHALTLGLRFKP